MTHRPACPVLSRVAFAFLLATPAWAETVHIGGTGALNEPLRRLGAHFDQDTGIKVEIIPGLGSAGGISAIVDGVLQVTVSGRAMKPNEAAGGLTSGLVVCTPYVLASSRPMPESLESTGIAAIYAQPSPKWADATPIRIILRPKAESDNQTMAALFPGVEQAVSEARMRDSVPVAATDQDNADLGERIPGSLIGSTYTQLFTENRALRFIAINGVLPDVGTYESGRYPFGKTIHVIVPRQPTPGAVRFLEFLRSPAGRESMRDNGIVPCPS